MLKIFLDANIYFAGAVSEDGASRLILEIALRKKILLYSSKLVLREAERNLRLKAQKEHLKFFHSYLRKVKIHVVPLPEDKVVEPFESLIHPKDLPVLGSAVVSMADYLLTLDKRHFFTATLFAKRLPFKIMTPGDFIREIYLKGKTSQNRNAGA